MMSKENENSKNNDDYQDVENPLNTNNQSLEDKWAIIKDDYQRKYPKLNDEDLTYLPDGFQKMTSDIASKTQRCNAEVHNEIRQWEI